MDHDLQTIPPRDDWYEWSLTAFYITYIGFEWMSLLWRLIPAHAYVSLMVFSWGLTASLQAIAPSYPVLVVLRAVLGIGEAGFTGIPFYLSFFYRREELALRTAMFVSAAPLATSFASSLAYLIVSLAASARSPIAPWRLLFLIEGFPSVLAAAAAWHLIPDSPESARYLTRRERRVARLRLRHQVAGPQPPPAPASRARHASPPTSSRRSTSSRSSSFAASRTLRWTTLGPAFFRRSWGREAADAVAPRATDSSRQTQARRMRASLARRVLAAKDSRRPPARRRRPTSARRCRARVRPPDGRVVQTALGHYLTSSVSPFGPTMK